MCWYETVNNPFFSEILLQWDCAVLYCNVFLLVYLLTGEVSNAIFYGYICYIIVWIITNKKYLELNLFLE